VVSNHLINTLSLLVVMAALAYGAWMVWRAPAPTRPGRGPGHRHGPHRLDGGQQGLEPQYVLWVFAAGALVSMPPRYGVVLGVISVADWVFEFVLRLPYRGDTFTVVGYAASLARTVISS